jgi:hypothetical protein
MTLTRPSSALASTAVPSTTTTDATPANTAPSEDQSPTLGACSSGPATLSTTMPCPVTLSCAHVTYPCPPGQTYTYDTWETESLDVIAHPDQCTTTVRTVLPCFSCGYCYGQVPLAGTCEVDDALVCNAYLNDWAWAWASELHMASWAWAAELQGAYRAWNSFDQHSQRPAAVRR